MSAKSLLFVAGATPFDNVPGCSPCRTETTVVMRSQGRLYTVKMRDKITVEDPYLVMVKAEAFAIAQGEPFNATPTPRTLRDFLIKSNVGG